MAVFISVFLISYLLHGLCVTVGYHRLMAHRSFRCVKAVEYLLVLGGYLAFQGSPVWWATIHRLHHKTADTERDPHSPKRGWIHAYMGWTLEDYNFPVEKICSDLVRDPVYALLDKIDVLAIPINLLARLILLCIFGWKVALANLLAGVCVFQIPMILNLFCHLPKFGYKNFPSSDNAVNVWWVAMLALGEGWHNNHHVYPGSARMGLRKSELDFSWGTIKLLARLGLASHVNEATLQRRAANSAVLSAQRRAANSAALPAQRRAVNTGSLPAQRRAASAAARPVPRADAS